MEFALYKTYSAAVDNTATTYYHSNDYRANIHGDFIVKKLTSQLTNATTEGQGQYRNRFDDVVDDFKYITKRPLLGWGIHKKTRFLLHPNAPYESTHGCGLTDLVAKFGFIGLTVFLLCLWKSCYHLSNSSCIPTVFAIGLFLLILVGENYMRFPFFFTLMFLGEKLKTPVCDS
jgi:hypothetical protein